MRHNHNNDKRLYKTARWQRRRLLQLQLEPLCETCKAKGLTVAAEVAHHIVPHKGDSVLFYGEASFSHCASVVMITSPNRKNALVTHVRLASMDGQLIPDIQRIKQNKNPGGDQNKVSP
jgi:hypothetical protein